jgi:hypothetical protein
MPALDPIDDSNTFPDKTEGGDVGEPTDLVAAADLNALKTVISENREQANDALAAAESAQTAADDAQGTADDALGGIAGAVPAAHTASTKTIASTDFGSIIRLDPTSNAIEVTIPHTLFAAGGTGRAWVCQVKVVSVAGGALTFVGSGGIVIEYYGKDPGTDAYIAGDWLTIVVDSATTASVFAVEAL